MGARRSSQLADASEGSGERWALGPAEGLTQCAADAGHSSFVCLSKYHHRERMWRRRAGGEEDQATRHDMDVHQRRRRVLPLLHRIDAAVSLCHVRSRGNRQGSPAQKSIHPPPSIGRRPALFYYHLLEPSHSSCHLQYNVSHNLPPPIIVSKFAFDSRLEYQSTDWGEQA